MKLRKQVLIQRAEQERLQYELIRWLGDVEAATLQWRPLRLAYFVCKLKASASSFFAVEDAILCSLNYPMKESRLTKREACQRKILLLQQGIAQGMIRSKLVNELRVCLTEYLSQSNVDFRTNERFEEDSAVIAYTGSDVSPNILIPCLFPGV